MGSHSLPCVTGGIANIPRAQKVCTLCQPGILRDEHLISECPVLQGVTDTMAYIGIMPLQWCDSCGNKTLVQLQKCIKYCIDAHCDPVSQASDEPQVFEDGENILSPPLSLSGLTPMASGASGLDSELLVILGSPSNGE